MDYNEQAKVTQNLLELERQMENLRESIARESEKTPPPKPARPQRQSVQHKQHPPVKSQMKFPWKMWLLVTAIAIVLSIVLSFIPYLGPILGGLIGVAETLWWFGVPILHFIRKRDDKKRIANSPEYLQQCKEIDEENKRMDLEAEKKFAQELESYEKDVIPAWEKECAKWNSEHDEILGQYHSELSQLTEEAEELYDSCKLFPKRYRNAYALEKIYETISSSDCDVSRAIDIYDRDEQRKLEEQRLRAQQEANDIAYEANAIANEQNALLDEQNQIADRARREANAAEVVRAVQHHNTNKRLKHMDER